MKLIDAIEKRTSVRSFTNEAVKIEDIKEMVRRGGLAPSVNNFQPWRFILIQKREKLNDLAFLISDKYKNLEFKNLRASNNIKQQVEWYSTFFKEAPALLALVMSKYETVLEKGTSLSHEEINTMRNFPDFQSAGACVQNVLLTAVELGYGACWLSGPMIAKEEIHKNLELANDETLVCFVAVGRPTKEFKPKQKEDLGDKIQIF